MRTGTMDDETAIWHVFSYFFVRDEFDRQSHGGNTTQREKNPMPMQRKQHFRALCRRRCEGGAESTGEIGRQQSEVNVD